jgi:WD40 repeat protein
MKKWIFAVMAIIFLLTAALNAEEKLAFISESTRVPNIYLFDPTTNAIDTVTSYPLDGVAGYEFTPDGKLLATAVYNPVSENLLGLKLVTWVYPYDYDKIVMTFYAKSWDAVRQQYKVAVNPAGTYVACVDTFGTMLVNLEEETLRYIFTHRQQAEEGVCGSYYNWGGEFSPDGQSFCLQSYCIANRVRYDVYNMAMQEYRNIYELDNITGFSWLYGSDGLLLSANSCGESAGLYIADLSPEIPLINLEVCNLAQAKCNQYFKEFYSEFLLPQVLGEEKFLVYARGVKSDGTILNDVFIIDQESQVITEVIKRPYIELKMSPSGRYLAGVINRNPIAKNGTIFIYDFDTKLSSDIGDGDSTCSQIQWIDLK